MNLTASIYLRKIQRNLQDFGWKFTLKRTFARLAKPFREHAQYRIYCIDLRRSSTPPSSPPKLFEFVVVRDDDRQLIDQIEHQAEWLRGDVADLIHRGALCVVAVQQGELAGFNLIVMGTVRIPLVHMQRTFPPRHAWSEFIGVEKRFRKRGLAVQLRYRVFEELRGRNITRLYGGAEATNSASLRLAEKVGFCQLADVTYRRTLCWSSRKIDRLRT